MFMQGKKKYDLMGRRCAWSFLAVCMCLCASGCTSTHLVTTQDELIQVQDNEVTVNNVFLESNKSVEQTAWTELPIVAHALGTVEGRVETNSKDAFLESYEKGHRLFECDFQLTSDGKLVLRHDWEQISYYNLEQSFAGVMDWETFMQTPIAYYYTPLGENYHKDDVPPDGITPDEIVENTSTDDSQLETAYILISSMIAQ